MAQRPVAHGGYGRVRRAGAEWIHIAMVGAGTAFAAWSPIRCSDFEQGVSCLAPSWSHLDGSLQAIAELVPLGGSWALSAEKSLSVFFAMLIVPVVLLWIAIPCGVERGPNRAATLCVAHVRIGVVPKRFSDRTRRISRGHVHPSRC